MGSNAIFFAWNRSIPGREKLSAAHFKDFVEYLAGQQRGGAIQSFEPVFLEPHGGDMNGFFLIRADVTKLDALIASSEWQTHMMRALLHLQGSGAVRAFVGEAVAERMKLFTGLIPA
ncbi:MAG TPA: hypothetical protein VHY91_08790 [Pirellulales bacterium]|jgi:hypothetical protein|nr:hypothetical protein [Pirellulales bacterium]